VLAGIDAYGLLAAAIPLALAILGVAWRLGALERTVKDLSDDVKETRDDVKTTRDDLGNLRDQLGGRMVGGRRWNDPQQRRGR
jgi:hypothetical protein